jgi:uncharacterized membrane protein YedE/YeeE
MSDAVMPMPVPAETPKEAKVESAAPPAAVATPTSAAKPYWNSYVAGALLGVVLLASFVVTGRGLGASGAMTRMAAYTLQKVDASVHGGTAAEHDTYARRNHYTAQYVNDASDPLDDFLVWLFVGVLVGGFASGVASGRAGLELIKGPNTTWKRRVFFAALGGFVSAIGARFARGCTSGQALSGGATLALGSWIFMLAVFAGGYAIAYFFRKEWR